MKFEFDRPPVIQEKKKYVNFKVTPIGGPTEIIKWRQQQEMKEVAYRFRLGARDQRIVEAEKELGRFDKPIVSGESWGEKVARANSERERLRKAVEAVNSYEWKPTPKTKQSLLKKVTSFFKKIWKDANF